MPLSVIRKNYMFNPDPSRIIARFSYESDERSAEIIKQVLAMPEWEVTNAVNKVLRGYSTRHRNISRIFDKYLNRLSPIFEKIGINKEELSPSQKALLGSYFTMEYSIESAAFFNPSIVEHPDQTEVRLNEKREFLVSGLPAKAIFHPSYSARAFSISTTILLWSQ
jgi:beta-1,2-mannobiose phosphorylase / 1,2-beta-oligomannan phosphorylase